MSPRSKVIKALLKSKRLIHSLLKSESDERRALGIWELYTNFEYSAGMLSLEVGDHQPTKKPIKRRESSVTLKDCLSSIDVVMNHVRSKEDALALDKLREARDDLRRIVARS